MKPTSLKVTAAVVVCITLLAACGGGNDSEAGTSTPFSVVPSTLTLTGPDALTCGSGDAGLVFIYGGVAPYRIDNTQPDIVVTDPPQFVNARGGTLSITFLPNNCINVPLVIVDQLDRQIKLTLISKKGT